MVWHDGCKRVQFQLRKFARVAAQLTAYYDRLQCVDIDEDENENFKVARAPSSQ